MEDRRRVAQEMLDELDTSRSQELGALLQSSEGHADFMLED